MLSQLTYGLTHIPESSFRSFNPSVTGGTCVSF